MKLKFASYCIAANMDISNEIDAYNKQEQIKKLSFQ